MPGDPAKVEEMARRYARGQLLFHELDGRVSDDEPATLPLASFARNLRARAA
jgi:hypothetical protein